MGEKILNKEIEKIPYKYLIGNKIVSDYHSYIELDA